MSGVLAIITARGGSKGLPGNNLRSLGGLPLIAWTVRAALEATCVARVIVSSTTISISTPKTAPGSMPFTATNRPWTTCVGSVSVPMLHLGGPALK